MTRTRYKVIKAPLLFHLNKMVNERLDSGWKCQGGVHTYVEESMRRFNYIQAMTIKEPGE